MENHLVAKISTRATLRAMEVGQTIEVEKSKILANKMSTAAFQLKRMGVGEWNVTDQDSQNTPTYFVYRKA